MQISNKQKESLQPVLFLSHGAPSMILEEDPAVSALRSLASTLPRPDAVLCISPHWLTAEVALSLSQLPETIHDFYGFPKALYQLQYPAPGNPQLARSLQQRLSSNGVTAKLVERGLDHGAWTPLMLLWPEADIPVLAMSLPAHRSAAELCRLGEQLRELRAQGVMIIASGSATHNLSRLAAPGSATECWATEFQRWLIDQLTRQQAGNLLNWQKLAPHARLAHPTTEHLDPLWIALGAATGDSVSVLYEGYSYGSLGMLHLGFGMNAGSGS